MPDNNSAWVIIATYGAVFEAEMARAMLESAGIPSQILGEHVGVFGPGWSGMTIRGVDLAVPGAVEEDAREVLGQGEGEDDDGGGGGTQAAA